MARELKIGDRVVDWKDRAGTVLGCHDTHFALRYDDGTERAWAWEEFDGSDPEGTFRFEDTEYPEWPR